MCRFIDIRQSSSKIFTDIKLVNFRTWRVMGFFLVAYLFICSVMILTIVAGKLTLAGALAGGVIAVLLIHGFGWAGLLLLGAFFIPAVVATSWKRRLKQTLALTENHHGRRDMFQVLANGGVAALLAVPAILQPGNRAVCLLLAASCFSAAVADTLSSELGSIYGKKFFNVISFRADLRGSNGVISLAGTLIGVGGSLFIACTYLLSVTNEWRHAIIIVVAGTVGNFTDSILGATLERRSILNNNMVNILNTIAGAATAAIIIAVTR